MGALALAARSLLVFSCLLELGARAAQSRLSCSYGFMRTAETIPIVVNEIIEKGYEIVGSSAKSCNPDLGNFLCSPDAWRTGRLVCTVLLLVLQ